MTYTTVCLNCGGDVFKYDPRDYEFVRLHPQGGIVSCEKEVSEDDDAWKVYDFNYLYDHPEQVTCACCGLCVERIRLDPDFRWVAKDLADFTIKIHG